MHLNPQDTLTNNPFSITGPRSSYLPTAQASTGGEDLELLISTSAVSAKASLLLSIMSVNGSRREELLGIARKVPMEILDAVIAAMTDASPFSHRVAAFALRRGSEIERFSAGELLMYAASLSPVIEAFSLASLGHQISEGDAMYDVRQVAAICQQRGNNLSLMPIDGRMDVARGYLIWVNTNPGVDPDTAGTDESLLWLGSQWRQVSTIVPELIERKSCDPLLITDLLRDDSSKILREGTL